MANMALQKIPVTFRIVKEHRLPTKDKRGA